jgi:hypothetical protein
MKTEAVARDEISKLARQTGRLPAGVQRKLQDLADLEQVQTLPAGTRVKASDGEDMVIHVDALRMHANRELKVTDPIIRLIVGGQHIHCREILIEGPSRLGEDYDNPLHDRESAICVLRTNATVKVIR